jgi:hypothetical protein
VIGGRDNSIRKGTNRGFQKLTSNPGPYGSYHSTIHNNIQVHKNIKGIDGWFGAGFREIRENANAVRHFSKQSEERGMIKFLLSLLRKHPSTKEDPISVLEENRKKQEAQLIEIWKATMDGEEGWFRKLSDENPECVIKMAHDCTKEVK